MIRDAKAQVEEQRKSREIQEAKEREKEQKRRGSGRVSGERRGGDAASFAGAVGRETQGGQGETTGTIAVGRCLSERRRREARIRSLGSPRGAETTKERRPSARLSGAPTAADDDENASKGDDENNLRS